LAEVLEDYDKAKKYYGQAIKLNKNYEPAQQNMRAYLRWTTSVPVRSPSTLETNEVYETFF
jgi:hypothetical protein